MAQILLAALVALAAQTAGRPTDEAVLAALPRTEAARTDVWIATSPIKHSGVNEGGRPVARRWACVVYSTQVVGGASVRRVEVVYLESAGK